MGMSLALFMAGGGIGHSTPSSRGSLSVDLTPGRRFTQFGENLLDGAKVPTKPPPRRRF